MTKKEKIEAYTYAMLAVYAYGEEVEDYYGQSLLLYRYTCPNLKSWLVARDYDNNMSVNPASYFPEFFSLQPKTVYSWMPWWGEGKAIRLRKLNQAISLIK